MKHRFKFQQSSFVRRFLGRATERREGGKLREEREAERVKSRCPERRPGVERRVWRKIPEKKKRQDCEAEQEIKRGRRGGGEEEREDREQKYQKDSKTDSHGYGVPEKGERGERDTR